MELLAIAAECVQNNRTTCYTTVDVKFKFPCAISAGDKILINTMRTSYSKVVPFAVTLNTVISFAITMTSDDRVIGARHVPSAVHKRDAAQVLRVAKYIRKRERAAIQNEERVIRRVVMAHKVKA